MERSSAILDAVCAALERQKHSANEMQVLIESCRVTFDDVAVEFDDTDEILRALAKRVIDQLDGETSGQPADVQDRDGAGPVLRPARRSYPFIVKAFADTGHAGDEPDNAMLIASRSSANRPGRSASWSILGDGWSGASSPASTAIDGSGKTRRPTSPSPGPSSTPLPS